MCHSQFHLPQDFFPVLEDYPIMLESFQCLVATKAFSPSVSSHWRDWNEYHCARIFRIKNYNLISKPYSIWRGIVERVCQQQEHYRTHRQPQTHLGFRHQARPFFTVPVGLVSYPTLVSFGGNLESPFHVALLVTEARAACHLSCPGRGAGVVEKDRHFTWR